MWKKLMGEVEDYIDRIGVLFCIDGIPAFTYKGLSLMPAEFLLLSLPPWLRYKEDNIMLSMLVPHTLSAASQLKFFKKVIADEFNDLLCTGVSAPFGNVKVKIVGQVYLLAHHNNIYCRCVTQHSHLNAFSSAWT